MRSFGAIIWFQGLAGGVLGFDFHGVFMWLYLFFRGCLLLQIRFCLDSYLVFFRLVIKGYKGEVEKEVKEEVQYWIRFKLGYCLMKLINFYRN